MDLSLSDDQQMLVDAFTGLLGKQATPDDVRAAEPLGFDPALWASLVELGPVQMAVDEDHGGWGAALVDLCLVAECLGRHCAPAPVVEAQVSARLLARLGDDALGPLLDGPSVATLALRAPVAGVAGLVPAGAVADLVIVRAGDDLVAVDNDPAPPQVPNHADLPLADVRIAEARTIGSGPTSVDAYESAVDEWLLLTASALVGLSASALHLAAEYAKERRAFGQPIGAFQGVAHRLADVATGVDGARLLVREAAWTADSGIPEAAERACGAFAFASSIARDATYWGIHTLGGYGVMLEYDTQLYFRRARGWAGTFGDPDAAYRRVARHRYARGRT